MSLACMVAMVMMAESDGSCEGSLRILALVTFNRETLVSSSGAVSSEEAGSVSVCGREMGGWDGGCECVGVRVFVYIKCTQTHVLL